MHNRNYKFEITNAELQNSELQIRNYRIGSTQSYLHILSDTFGITKSELQNRNYKFGNTKSKCQIAITKSKLQIRTYKAGITNSKFESANSKLQNHSYEV